MRLGFWNRLAIVAGGAWSIGYATYLTNKTVAEMSSAMEARRAQCQFDYMQGEIELSVHQKCLDATNAVIPRGEIWMEALGVSVGVALVAYLIIIACLSIAAWVWAGRKA